jgi:hypothetical protein
MGWYCHQTTAANGHIVHPPDDTWVWTAAVEWHWYGNNENSRKTCLSAFVHRQSHTDWPGCEPGPPLILSLHSGPAVKLILIWVTEFLKRRQIVLLHTVPSSQNRFNITPEPLWKHEMVSGGHGAIWTRNSDKWLRCVKFSSAIQQLMSEITTDQLCACTHVATVSLSLGTGTICQFYIVPVGVRLCLWTAATYVPTSHSPYDIWAWRATVGWYWQGKFEELGEKPVPLPLCPPQIPRVLTRASVVGGRRLTAWAVARRQSVLLAFTHLVFGGTMLSDLYKKCHILQKII